MDTDTHRSIMIIDNDEGVTRAIAARLEHHGYDCICASSGAQGLSEFQARPVDLVISDLNMPAGDGISLARSLRVIRDVPIIFVTGFQEEYRKQLRALPNVSVLTKPFDANNLIELVEAELVLNGCAVSAGGSTEA